jgi:hypothetical protein
MSEVVKLTVNLTPEAATVLKYLAAKQGTSATNLPISLKEKSPMEFL